MWFVVLATSAPISLCFANTTQLGTTQLLDSTQGHCIPPLSYHHYTQQISNNSTQSRWMYKNWSTNKNALIRWTRRFKAVSLRSSCPTTVRNLPIPNDANNSTASNNVEQDEAMTTLRAAHNQHMAQGNDLFGELGDTLAWITNHKLQCNIATTDEALTLAYWYRWKSLYWFLNCLWGTQGVTLSFFFFGPLLTSR